MSVKRARKLRKEMTPAERKLWPLLKTLPIAETHFRKQVPISKFIADFACMRARLIVELDGEQHALGDSPARNDERTAWLESQGFKVLRFWNHEVIENPEGIAETILNAARDRAAQFWQHKT
ncbi:MAG: DUF559 domain-containing protein [Alphaproteobacteria bacterium]